MVQVSRNCGHVTCVKKKLGFTFPTVQKCCNIHLMKTRKKEKADLGSVNIARDLRF